MLKGNGRNPEDFKGFPMAGEEFAMAGEVLDWPASQETIDSF